MTSAAPLEDVRQELGLSVPDLWMAYFALGGTKTAAELGDYLVVGDAAVETSDADHDAVVHALNEASADRGVRPTLTYRAA